MQSLRRARRLVLADQAAYEATWATTLQDPEERAAINRLERLERSLNFTLEIPARQLNRIRRSEADSQTIHRVGSASSNSSSSSRLVRTSSISPLNKASTALRSFARSMSSLLDQPHRDRPAWADLVDYKNMEAVDPKRPATCLGQLYCQATALSPILIKKVQDWAAATGGYFMAAGAGSPPVFVRWEDVREDEFRTGGRVRWASLKSLQRAIEKANRSYGKVRSVLVRHLYMHLRSCNKGSEQDTIHYG